ncbi:hypothetical protein [Burkholderia ambifaria]|uniref:hypothetical protein n=1 Tax=Burkholderia ambifaria TaxID=152480 RepID=UPI001F443B96|nr:hypothetical protein [Burkholderia ambifaria]
MTEKEHADCPYFLHSSIHLHAMVQQLHTSPNDEPDAVSPRYSGNMQMLLVRTPDPCISTYLSPLDAVIGSRALMRDDGHFWPIDFRQVDTRRFIEQQGRLLVAVNYAYGASEGRLVASDTGHPLMVNFSSWFDVPVEQRDHFTIRFDDSATQQIDDIYRRAGLPRFAETLDMMRTWTAEEIADAEAEALACMPPTVTVAGAAVDQYAIYDPESGEWIITDFD